MEKYDKLKDKHNKLLSVLISLVEAIEKVADYLEESRVGYALKEANNLLEND